MMHTTVGPGQVLPLYRRVSGCPDPLALFAALTDNGTRPDTILLESADAASGVHERSILIPRAALRVTCLGPRVEVRALTGNGASVLPWLTEALRSRGFRVQEAVTAPSLAPRPRPHAPPRPATEQLRAFDAFDDAPPTEPFARRPPASTPTALPALLCTPPPAPEHPRDEATRLREPSVLDVLRTLVLGMRCISAPSPMAHFAAGILDYDLVDLFEDLPPAADAAPEDRRFGFWIPEACILIDHRAADTTVLASVFGGPEAERAYHDATREIERLTRAVQAAPADAPPPGPPPAPAAPDDVATDTPDDTFAARVDTLKQHIVAGDVFQIVPSRSFSLPCADPLAAYGVLRRTNPSPYMFFVRDARSVLLGASPETCVRVRQPERRIEICPIAGTARRGRSPDGSLDADLDTRLEAELRADTKELAEHMMLVDLARNDVARVSVHGTRQVRRLLTVERYSHVMHLVSVVDGTLAPDLDALHAYAACMNMGTLVGAPKLRAAELLRQHEATRRGPYGGAVGFLTFRGEMNTAIVIRSATVRDGLATVRAGAGVVHDSIPQREAEETRRKAASVLAAIAAAGRGES